MSMQTPVSRDALQSNAPMLGVDRFPSKFGKFTLRRRLARGGMADVVLATLPGAEGFEKELVVKLVRPELAADEGFVRRFVDEAKTCVRLTHPNIVSIFELGVEGGVLYMAMELVRGATLAELLREGGPLSPDEGAYVALEVARALDHAHRRGVIHRDVTPGNVMLDEEGAVKLLDFGIAAPVGDSTHEVFGTPGHMPLEQIEGTALTPAADLFALATVVVEAWTGRPLYRRGDTQASKTALQTESIPKLSSSSPTLAPLDELVASCLAKRADERPQQAEQVARVLRAFLRERSMDLDEVARGLRRRVTRAMAARDAAAEGRALPAPPMPRTLRPTPYAEATRTFATRGDSKSWEAPADSAAPNSDANAASTRRIEEPSKIDPGEGGTRKLNDAAEKAGGAERRKPEGIEPVAQVRTTTAATESATRATRGRWWLPMFAALALLIAAAAVLRNRSSGSTTATTTPGASSVAGAASSFGTSTSSSASASASASNVAALAGTSASTNSSASPSPGAASGTLSVRATPPASVNVDGRAVGQTPVSVPIAAGDHRVVLRPTGLSEAFERRVSIPAGAAVEVRGDFNDEPIITVVRTGGR